MAAKYADYDPGQSRSAPPNDPVRQWKRFGILLGVAVGLALGAIGLARYFHVPAAAELTGKQSQEPPFPENVPPYAINTPEAVPASQADLKDDEPVFGVAVDGKHRAYCVRAFGGLPMFHVVNDKVGDRPISIAHCDRTDCTLVAGGKKGDPLLKLTFGAWYKKQMYVRANGEHYYSLTDLSGAKKDSPPFPYEPIKYERTTWGEWRKAHPDTDVYIVAPRTALHPVH